MIQPAGCWLRGREVSATDGESVLGANVFGLAHTVPDCLRALSQVTGSPFDSAGRGSIDLALFASKKSGVRVPLAQDRDCIPDLDSVPWGGDADMDNVDRNRAWLSGLC